MPAKSYHTLRLILGDQLNHHHSWFQAVDESNLYVIMEIRQETDYVRHHIQKICGFFAAMRAFARELEEDGHAVTYITLDDKQNRQSIEGNVRALIKSHKIARFEYQLPDEYRLDQYLKVMSPALPCEINIRDTEHFMTERDEVGELFASKKQWRMESFYRHMRRKYEILMDGDHPVGGRWNFDEFNRKPYRRDISIPPGKMLNNDVTDIYRLVKSSTIDFFGAIDPENFSWPINSDQAQAVLTYFIRYLLPQFGTYQDAMTIEHKFLYHSRLSFALNAKMISPGEVIQAVVAAWCRDPEKNSLSQVEGFVRQVLGWREYMRGIYWSQMPDYGQVNYFDHARKLPHYYWDGDTRMNCLKHAIGQSLSDAYAHHIQRLMITGNFALLAGVAPDEVDAWYMGVYIDAVEWVEITNTRGMSQFADGGLIASKPYVSSANYINKMSDYCRGCPYDAKKKYGSGACPFNSLYWDFYDRNRTKMEKNPRIGMMYRTWDNMSSVEKRRIKDQAKRYLDSLETL